MSGQTSGKNEFRTLSPAEIADLYVPYSGATKTVNLGARDLVSSQVITGGNVTATNALQGNYLEGTTKYRAVAPIGGYSLSWEIGYYSPSAFFQIPVFKPTGYSGVNPINVGAISSPLYILAPAGGAGVLIQNILGDQLIINISATSGAITVEATDPQGTYWMDDFKVWALTNTGGRVIPPTVVDTATYDILVTEEEVFFDTALTAITAEYPEIGVGDTQAKDGQHYRLVNAGSAGNAVTLNLFGGALYATLYDGESIIRTYSETLSRWI